MALVLLLVAGACASDADDVPPHEPWRFEGDVPESLLNDVPPGGDVVVSLENDVRTVAMVSFPGEQLAELVTYYDDRFRDENHERSEYTVIAETEAVWTVKWVLSGLEVRVQQCIDSLTRLFSLTCIAVDRHR